MFTPVNPRPDFPAMERDRLAWWRRTGMMQKYLRRNEQSAKRWSFVDGPITANNPMGVHHAWGRTYKDVWQRFKTMQGYRQRYQNGFDGQGLWVEVEVEKELGFKSKRDIEDFGIDRFVELCKERVKKFAGVQTEQSIRLGYWMDWDNSYHTMSDENNYTIWHFLKVCHQRGWLYEGTDVMPWCPRCGTGISNQEIATEGYLDLVHDSPTLRFPLEDRTNESLLVWTTTPWTLSSNVAAAVHPDLTYVKARQGNEAFYLAKGRLSSLRGEYTVERELKGSELVGLTYRGPYDELPAQRGVVHKVIPWDEVSEAEGTGIVHIAPGAGAEDFALGKEHGLAVIAPLDDSGVFVEGFGWLTGNNAAEVPQAIFDDLRSKALLYRVERYSHRYPTCWRCSTELVFRLVSEWFISMKDLRHLIADVTRKITWVPEFGMERELDWLRNMDDWMISKKRYWGLALPIYKCSSCGQFEVIGSEAELKQRAVEGWDQFAGHSPHRPWVDAVKIACSKCGAKVSRILDVGNPWLDAGIVPFSTLVDPGTGKVSYLSEDKSYWQEWFPADWISESFPGQFRNWFYSLLTMSTVLEEREPFKCVFSYAMMRDEKGEEMHKSKGNAIWFDDAAERAGVDAMRWLYFSCNPASNLNFGYTVVDEVRRRFIIPLWNVYNFFVTYARLDGFDPTRTRALASAAPLDRWIVSELNTLVADVTRHLEEFNPQDAARRVEEFVEALSNWYVRRSRRRFWKSGSLSRSPERSEGDEDKLAAYHTLYECLTTLTELVAPVIPFLTEEMYQNLVRSVDPQAPESVHLCDWPVADVSKVDADLAQATQLAMRVASLGRAARSKAKTRVRQPLGAVLVRPKTPEEAEALRRVADQVLDELNVKALEALADEAQVVEYQVQPNLALLGPKYGPKAQVLGAALRRMNAAAVVSAVAAEQPMTVDGMELLPEEIIVRQVDKPGYAVASEGGYTVAVRTEVTPDLQREGMARELVHRIQNLRRDAGFDIADRITTWYQGAGMVQEAMERFADYVKAETLSLDLVRGDPPSDAKVERVRLDGQEVALGVRRG